MIQRSDVTALICVITIWMANVIAMPQGYAWLDNLALPASMPPYWVFTPVWVGVYLCVVISLAYALRMKYDQFTISVWIINLIANGSWGVSFFVAQSLWLATCVAACIAITAMMLVYIMSRYEWWAGALVVPYALWTTYATYLSYGIALLN